MFSCYLFLHTEIFQKSKIITSRGVIELKKVFHNSPWIVCTIISKNAHFLVPFTNPRNVRFEAPSILTRQWMFINEPQYGFWDLKYGYSKAKVTTTVNLCNKSTKFKNIRVNTNRPSLYVCMYYTHTYI